MRELAPLNLRTILSFASLAGMNKERHPRCYNIQDIPSFFLEGLDPSCAVVELHLGEERVRLTREAFYSMVGSFAKIAVDLLETEPRRQTQVH